MERYASFVIVAAVLIIWYWRQARAVRAAGGREALAQQQLAAEFGLAPGEVATQIWGAQSYLGALRPGEGEASLIDRVANSLEKTNQRSALFHVAVTSHGRVVVSREPRDGVGRSMKC